MVEGCNARIIQQCFAYWSVDFQGHQADGTVTDLREQMQGRQQLFQQASQYRTREELILVSVNGNRAEVAGLEYSDYIIGDKHIYTQDPYLHIWERTNEGWVLVSSSWYEGYYDVVATERERSPTPANQQLSPEMEERIRRMNQYTVPVPSPSRINQINDWIIGN